MKIKFDLYEVLNSEKWYKIDRNNVLFLSVTATHANIIISAVYLLFVGHICF